MPRSLNPSEQGTRDEFVFRYGPEVPMLGHRRRGDAGTIRLPHFEFLQNVRFNDGIGGRPGSQMLLNGLGDIVTSLYDFQTTGPDGKLYIIYNGVPGCSVPFGFVGFSLDWFDPETYKQFNRGVAYSSTTSACMGTFGGDLYLGIDDTLKRFITINPDYEDEAVFISGFDQSEDLKVFTGYAITSMRFAFGELYIGLTNKTGGGVGNSKVVRYDGVTFRDDDTGIDSPISMSLFRDEMLVVGIATSGLRVRTEAGVWSTVAGAVAPTKQESYRDLLYLVDDTASIYTFDGAAIASVHTIAGARIAGLAVFDELLYFGYGTAAFHAIVGTLDKAGTYTDVHKDITAQDPGDGNFNQAQRVSQLAFYRGGLIAGVANDNPITQYGGRLMGVDGINTAGTWVALTPYDITQPEYQIIVAFETF